MKRVLLISTIGCSALFYVYMYTEGLAVSVHGEKRGSHGRNCTFVDTGLNLHKVHIRGENGSWWIHGCPFSEYVGK
ncbi:MAG: hypothetical protein AAF423_13780 [Pseudomonadota bacterium]